MNYLPGAHLWPFNKLVHGPSGTQRAEGRVSPHDTETSKGYFLLQIYLIFERSLQVQTLM